MRFAPLFGAALLAMPAAAAASPAYVECMFKQGDGSPWPLQITLDEARASVVVLTKANGRATTMPGAFGPVDVRFGEGGVTYLLDRVTLEIQRETRFLRLRDAAKCKLAATPKRAF